MHGEIGENAFVLCKLLYIILAVIIAIRVSISYKENKRLFLFDYFSIYYVISHCLCPFFILDKINSGAFIANLMINNDKYQILAALATVFVYIVISLTIFLLNKTTKNKFKPKKTINIFSNRFWVFNTVYLIFLYICLVLWTLHFGSIFGMFKYATALRDGFMTVDNQFAILSRFCTAFALVFYTFLEIAIRDYKNRKQRFWLTLVLCLLSLLGSVINLINLDSRSLMIVFVLITAVILYKNKAKKTKVFKISFAAIALLICALCLGVQFKNDDHSAKDETSGNPLIETITKEYAFIYTNNINTLYMYNNKIMRGDRIIDNIIEIPFSWMPSTMKPKELINMNEYNTSFHKEATGELPVNIVSGSIMSIGWIGLLIIPMFYGWLITVLERFFAKRNGLLFYRIVYLYFGISVMQSFVTYIDIAPILLSLFGLIIYVIMANIICAEPIKEEHADNHKI